METTIYSIITITITILIDMNVNHREQNLEEIQRKNQGLSSFMGEKITMVWYGSDFGDC